MPFGIKTMCKRGLFRRWLARFRDDQRGNVIMIFGLSLVPLMGVIGVAVDYSRASRVRQTLSSAVDSAALMAARDAQTLTDAQLTDRINNWLKANLPADVQDQFTGATVAIDRKARTVKIVANGNVPATVAQVLGTTNLPVSTMSQSTWGTNTIELALVLDNTGSMSSNNKMTALKQASKDLVKIMQDATQETDQIRISIVPFATQVRIDRSFQNEPWMRYGATRNCKQVWNYQTWQYEQQCETMTKATWAKSTGGCIQDRDQSYDTNDSYSFGSQDQQYPAYWCAVSSLAEIMPLTSNWSALNSRIDAMTPSGNTNVTIGAVWGWTTLSPNAPFTEAKPYGEPRLKKYMILLTDGDNTQNRYTSNQSQIDSRTALACTNIKASGIQLYTIRVMDGNATLLRNCASSANMYYEVTSASQLSPIFKSIAAEISQVRLTQ
ncbi:Flp pilus assembly protein TadG [Bosea sp. TND4EK4]|nr:Flp pilus assembly protein TadG [Bosea sp. TND4EK4]